MNRIRCFLITFTGKYARKIEEDYCSDKPLYTDNDGNIYYTGDEEFTSEDGYIIKPAPVGAMFDADWYHGIEGFPKGADGRVLAVRTPAGDWIIDQRARNGSGWTRTGEVPNISVTPSILITTTPKQYHGILSDGYLVEC